MTQHAAVGRYVLVGAVGAGKTTLFNALNGDYGLANKTQAVEFNQQGDIDTPGEFFSHPRLYRALINTTSEADIIIYVHAADDMTCRLPSGLLDIYHNKPVITVITKIDLPNVDVTAVEQMLINHGVGETIFVISNHHPESIARLATLLKSPTWFTRIKARGSNNE